MALTVHPITPHFGAELRGAELTAPLSDGDRKTILETIERWGVVLFRDTGLDDASHVAFSRQLGEVYVQPNIISRRRRPMPPELFEAGNINADNEIEMTPEAQWGRRGNQQWHTDHSFMERRSAYSILLAHEVPEGQGDTGYADLRGAYEALPQEMKARIEGLEAEHSIWYSRMTGGYPITEEEIRDRQPFATWPMVMDHLGSGRRTLYIASHIRDIKGMPTAQARALVAQLIEHATQPQFTFIHKWRNGDLVIWDNRCTMHRATPFADEELRRDLRRTNVLDPVELPTGISPTRRGGDAIEDLSRLGEPAGA